MFELLVNLVIRPPRAQYDPAKAMPGPALRVDGKHYTRHDLQAGSRVAVRLGYISV